MTSISKLRDEVQEIKILLNQLLSKGTSNSNAADAGAVDLTSLRSQPKSREPESEASLKAFGKYCDLLATNPAAAGAYYQKNADAICEGQGMVRAANRKKD